MATTRQIIALIQAHVYRNNSRFRQLVQQMAAGCKSESGRAEMLRALGSGNELVPLNHAQDNLLYRLPACTMDDLVLDESVRREMESLALEWEHRGELIENSVPVRRRLLFEGAPGNGKTSAAVALSLMLGVTAYVLSLSNSIESYLGKTGSNLGVALSALTDERMVILDELDALGTARSSKGGDVGEANRIVNTMLMLLDQYQDGVLVATTNRADMLDPALIDRFDLVLKFEFRPELAQRLARSICEKNSIGFDDLDWQDQSSYRVVTKRVLHRARGQMLGRLQAKRDSIVKSA